MGRPREFDEGEFLEAAAEVFWAKGYRATSTRDLTESTGLTSASMYNAFDDKRALYLGALAQYLDRTLRRRRSSMQSAGDGVVGLRRSSRTILADPRHRGCLLGDYRARSDIRGPRPAAFHAATHTLMTERSSMAASSLDSTRARFRMINRQTISPSYCSLWRWVFACLSGFVPTRNCSPASFAPPWRCSIFLGHRAKTPLTKLRREPLRQAGENNPSNPHHIQFQAEQKVLNRRKFL